MNPRSLLGAVAIGFGVLAAAPSIGQGRACAPPQATVEGWSASFVAGCTDRNGKFAGGSQVMHLVPHKGRLYSATGYWKDSHNIWYGGSQAQGFWGQVLGLSGPGEAWSVDLELGPRHLRAELLKSLTFTQDPRGQPLSRPETLLIAATYDGFGGVSLFVRNDETGAWTRSKISGHTGKTGEDNSVRAARVYRDRITGREQLFLSVGMLGVYTASYDPAHRGTFAWSAAPELGPTRTRILAMVEANDSLFASEGAKIFQRIDGPGPRWETVFDMSGEADSTTSRATFQSIGGIRGLSAIDGPLAGRKSLIFVWTAGTTSKACVHRLDPKPDGSWAHVREVCLAGLMGQRLDGAPVAYALAAYNEFMPLADPASGEPLHLIGVEGFIPNTPAGQGSQHLVAHNERNAKGGYYAGATYALRDARGHWRLGEVNGRYRAGLPELVSIYTAALSPFDRQTIFLGGYDPNDFASTDTGWVSSTSLSNLIAGR